MPEGHLHLTFHYTDDPGEAEEERDLLAHFSDVVSTEGSRIISAGWDGPTTGAVNLLDYAASEPASEPESLSPEVKTGVTPPGAGTAHNQPRPAPTDSTADAATTTTQPAKAARARKTAKKTAGRRR